ncbi:MAG: fibronectin type III domain-containing protein [Bdellovibrionaceae bacterium]|nr:fibronectin type III domain-containing protein [Pseudobdellovibrionaceae bacterium]
MRFKLTKKRFYITRLICLCGIVLLLGSCLGKESEVTSGSSSNPSSPTDPASDFGFTGVSSVSNLDDTRIQISWSAATGSDVIGYRVYEMQADGSLTTLATVPTSILSYIHSGLTAGTLHNYVVRAVDNSNETDGNFKILSGLTYAGITSATLKGFGQVDVAFPAGSTDIQSLKIYGTVGASTTLLKTVSSASTTASLTGLTDGANYSFTVKAVSNLGQEDENLSTEALALPSSYDSQYNGVMLVKAFGDAPGAPTGQPTAKQVSVTWLAFTGATVSTEYVLVRVGQGGVLDMSSLPTCTNVMTSSCQVCTATGVGPKTCTDTNVASSPQKYDYVVTLKSGGTTYELPTSNSAYRVTVPVPPSNMALVHRDSANFEMCQLMGKTSDPLNKQRCAYTGLGAVPYDKGSSVDTAPLGLSASFYDFGYNLFVDRWELGCKWTSNANGGMCGASATPGDCYGVGTPAGSIGVAGNVYYDTTNGHCRIHDGSSWVELNSSSLSDTNQALAVTNNPSDGSGKNPPLVRIDQIKSHDVCQALEDGDYGKKRLLRHREFIAASARPRLSGEPGEQSDSAIASQDVGSNLASSPGCNSSNHGGVTMNGSSEFPQTDLAGDATDTIKSVVLGADLTRECVSRFGIQDLVGNVWEWTSDQLDTCNAATDICVGGTSTLDSGNRDMLNFQFDGVQGPGGVDPVNDWTFDSESYSASNMSLPLGLPLVGNDNGNAVAINTLVNPLHGDRIWLYTNNGNGVPARGLLVGGAWYDGSNSGRWASVWSDTPTGTYNNIGARCALPAY